MLSAEFSLLTFQGLGCSHCASCGTRKTVVQDFAWPVTLCCLLSTVGRQAVSIHCSDWAFKVTRSSYGGVPHVTISTIAGVKAKTAGDVVRNGRQGQADGAEHVLCRPSIRCNFHHYRCHCVTTCHCHSAAFPHNSLLLATPLA